MLRIAKSGSLGKERAALEALATSPERAAEALETAVQELYAARETVRTFGGDASNKNIAERYTRDISVALTGLKIPTLQRNITAALEALYNAIDVSDQGSRTLGPTPPLNLGNLRLHLSSGDASLEAAFQLKLPRLGTSIHAQPPNFQLRRSYLGNWVTG